MPTLPQRYKTQISLYKESKDCLLCSSLINIYTDDGQATVSFMMFVMDQYILMHIYYIHIYGIILAYFSDLGQRKTFA